jgi:rhamnogalacturonyl hydrolase YesR
MTDNNTSRNNPDQRNRSSADAVYYSALNNALNRGYSPDSARDAAQRAVREYWQGNADVEEEEDF